MDKCYHKEVFGLGVLIAFFIFYIITVFWEEIERLIGRMEVFRKKR